VTFRRDDVFATARRVFPEREPSEILAILDEYGAGRDEPERERVQLAILNLTDGQDSRLHHFVAAAKLDYRDVLSWSEASQRPLAGAPVLGVLRRSWAWALLEPKRVLDQNCFGNLLVELVDGTIWRVCPEDLTVSKVADSAAHLASLWADDEFQVDWLVESWVKIAQSTLGPLEEGQCYGFKIWPVLGGTYDAQNMAIKSLCEWLDVSGDVARQAKDLPPGTAMRIDVRDA
jgi:hypothetical protein